MKSKEIVKSMTDIEFVPKIVKDSVNLNEYNKVSYDKIALFGTGFTAFVSSFREIALSESGGVVYKAFTKDGLPLILHNKAKDSAGFIGGYINKAGKTAQAHFFQFNSNPTAMVNPTMLMMTFVLASIEKKLDDIQKTQQEMLEFLKEDKRSKLEGDLCFLTDTLNNFKYNWENQIYKTNMHIKVQDVKQTAEQNVIFYRTQIQKMLNQRDLIVTDGNLKSKLRKIQSEFQNYRLSLYLFGFSAFLEVVLLENFNSGYLDSLSEKAKEYSDNYKKLHDECNRQFNELSGNSVQTHFLNGLSTMSGALGKAIAKMPVVSKSQLDENLISASDGINTAKIDKNELILKRFEEADDCIAPFIENIVMINHLCNQPSELLFDSENLYLK